jgi:hypothetical protein
MRRLAAFAFVSFLLISTASASPKKHCPEGEKRCGAACFNLNDDRDNCGRCHHVCKGHDGAGAMCANGKCV